MGISTVIMNKRGNACPKCLPFVGKILIDDVWSNGKQSDGSYMLMSSAIAAGLYHPNCKDIHTTYFEGISSPGASYTQKELEQVGDNFRSEQKQQYAKHQADKFGRFASYSLDESNKQKYTAKSKLWKRGSVKETNINRQYDYHEKSLERVESEISNLDYEVGVVFNKNGNAVGSVHQLGDAHEVSFASLMRRMKGGTVTHNHPYSTPPSPEDLYLLKKSKAKELRACGKRGTYVIRYTKDLDMLPEFAVFNKEYSRIEDMIAPKYADKMRNGQITAIQAEVLYQEEVWEYLRNKYGIDISFVGGRKA